MRCGHGAGHRDEPPDVTTGGVFALVGGELVVGVVAESLLPDEPDVVEPDELVPLVCAAPEVALAPGCSLDTATPINAVAPTAARIAVRVKVLTRVRARWRASGVLRSLGCRMGINPLKSAGLAPRSRPSVGRL